MINLERKQYYEVINPLRELVSSWNLDGVFPCMFERTATQGAAAHCYSVFQLERSNSH